MLRLAPAGPILPSRWRLIRNGRTSDSYFYASASNMTSLSWTSNPWSQFRDDLPTEPVEVSRRACASALPSRSSARAACGRCHRASVACARGHRPAPFAGEPAARHFAAVSISSPYTCPLVKTEHRRRRCKRQTAFAGSAPLVRHPTRSRSIETGPAMQGSGGAACVDVSDRENRFSLQSRAGGVQPANSVCRDRRSRLWQRQNRNGNRARVNRDDVFRVARNLDRGMML